MSIEIFIVRVLPAKKKAKFPLIRIAKLEKTREKSKLKIKESGYRSRDITGPRGIGILNKEKADEARKKVGENIFKNSESINDFLGRK